MGMHSKQHHFKDNEAIVKLLLENGAEVNAKGGEYGNALQAASFNGMKMRQL
jgi:ankyrin repeat protein